MADVILVMGSDSDAPVAKRAVEMLERFGVDYDVTVSSAHRSPARTGRLARNAEKNGAKIIIAFAGHAA
ncbi:MAG: AIR carboxylase family protein, partial [Candidatus Hydrogenedentes bacterium]|nr:AIR carboxylase family protein [Candidatus Hydrogenedentota bacterium]